MNPLSRHSIPEEKIACFRALFRGRADVYARRFQSRKTGRTGYQPACGNEWVSGICDKPKIRCSDCPHQRWLAMTDEVVGWHLSGADPKGHPFIMGLYPMLPDETCFLLAADFDGKNWQDDVGAFRDTCRAAELPVAIERSRSGNGAHAWFFFEQALPATLARKLGCHLLTETMERRPEIGLASYDRLFPNQDTLPKGGFGNLIALPLQKQARALGNSVFLEEDFHPSPDQWTFLAAIKTIPQEVVEALVAQAELKNRVLGVRVAPAEDFALTPWDAPPSRRTKDPPLQGPLPERLHVTLADQVYFQKSELSPSLRNRLIRFAAFQNPEFYRAQAMRLPTYDKPRVIACAEEHPEHIALPRGCFGEANALLTRLGIKVAVDDRRLCGTPLPVQFTGELRQDQHAAAEAMLEHDIGVLAATTAFGKTVLAAWLIAKRGVNTLVVVHRQQLLEQWVERLSEFLDVPPKSIGRLGGGRRRLTGNLDVALLQSLVRKHAPDDRVGDYGFLVVDECHHLPAHSFELVARRAKAKYVLGLSATVARKDGHHPILFMQCGPVRHRVDAKQQAAKRPFTHVVIARPTAFRPQVDPAEDMRVEFHNLCQGLLGDTHRNTMICEDVAAALNDNRHPLVLTERTEHLAILARELEQPGRRVIQLRGGMAKQELRTALDALRADAPGEPRVVLATGRFIGEGFDDARLDTLFLAMPISWHGTIIQYVGRLHRWHEGKREVRVYDYADLDVPMLARMFDKRCAGYESAGYEIRLPASAVPGWPPEMPLPVDPQWKREYAASVRRLIRDGVDHPLADLFVRAAAPAGIGPGQARSASEAFLYRRLESLTATRGRFRLNAELPIPFAGRAVMEVDFLCADAKLVLELDGTQHLADEVAWRRDRLKDALLQQHGYFVLRFLAADTGKHLDSVLDGIHAALAHRANTGHL